MNKTKKKDKVPSDIVGYWWHIDDGEDKGKYLFNDVSGSIRKGFVTDLGEIRRYYFLSNKIISDYNRIKLLPQKLVNYTKLSKGEILNLDGTLTIAPLPTINTTNETENFLIKKKKLEETTLVLNDNRLEIVTLADLLIANEFHLACFYWVRMSLAGRYQAALIYEVLPAKIDRMLDRYLMMFVFLLEIAFKLSSQ
jgi:hypothetical protein